MVTVVVVEREAVLTGVEGAPHGLAVALVKLVLVDAPVPQREHAAQQVVRGVRAQYLRRCQLPGRAYGDGDVRHRREVRHAQLLARRAVYVSGNAAVVCHCAKYINRFVFLFLILQMGRKTYQNSPSIDTPLLFICSGNTSLEK